MIGEHLVIFGVLLSIILSLFIGVRCRSSFSSYVLKIGGMFFLVAYLNVLTFEYGCEGHAFIGYARCLLFSDPIAAIASRFNAFAVVSYLVAAGPLFILAISAELYFRWRETRK
ncbi:hypothetical protein BDE40_3590 [Litoreibacter halocynthiae]|uniref:Uncharacterized protein n=1 Tax=Litoreibacter halocynthiae TaxID=1242689 RepID=A0A4R7LB91_9RHOB|nr:hypothetical protein BDE40_3590 [Litoreibacter halocynthiae]